MSDGLNWEKKRRMEENWLHFKWTRYLGKRGPDRTGRFYLALAIFTCASELTLLNRAVLFELGDDINCEVENKNLRCLCWCWTEFGPWATPQHNQIRHDMVRTMGAFHFDFSLLSWKMEVIRAVESRNAENMAHAPSLLCFWHSQHIISCAPIHAPSPFIDGAT